MRKKIAQGLIGMDILAEKVGRRFDQAVNSITGWSSFRTAKLLMHSGMTILLVASAWGFVHDSMFTRVWDTFGIIYLFWLWRKMHSMYKRMEDAWDDMKAGPTQLPWTEREFDTFAYWRILGFWFYAAFFVTDIIFQYPPSTFGGLIAALSAYVLLNGRPKKKSVVRRAVEAGAKAARAVAEKAKELAPSPAPVPIPIGVNG